MPTPARAQGGHEVASGDHSLTRKDPAIPLNPWHIYLL